MLPMLQRELIVKNKWLTDGELTDLFSVSQCLPGIIAANIATFVGYRSKGVSGAVAAVLGVVTPSVIVILLIAVSLTSFTDNVIVQRAFTGLRVCVSVLILNAVFKLRKQSVVDLQTALIFAFVLILSVYMLLPVAALVALAGACGIVIGLFRKKADPKGGA
jgi:chromate transporter